MTTSNIFALTELMLFILACAMVVLMIGCAPEEAERQAGVHSGYYDYQQFVERDQ